MSVIIITILLFNLVLAHGTDYLRLITLMEGGRASLSPYNTVKPRNSGHFGDSHYVRSRLSRRLPTKPRPPRAPVGVRFIANCIHAEIVERVDEAAERALVDKETYTRWHCSAIGRLLVKSALL